MRSTYLLFLALNLLVACNKGPAVVKSFYYWKTVYQTSDIAPEKLKGLQQLYVRVFDVDRIDGAPRPVSVIQFKEQSTLPLVPVIYITNRTLEGLQPPELDTLARQITQLTKKVVSDFSELQLDCDWTLGTKRTYFELIRKVRQQLDSQVVLSATIRLHQLKFAATTGIPPVDRGTLMLYNMSKLRDYATNNSIFDAKVAQSYLSTVEHYPLPLDLGLPTFKQLVLFRNQQFVTTLRAPYYFDPNLQKSHFRPADRTYFRCIKDTIIRDIQVEVGDELRLENVPNTSDQHYAAVIANICKLDTVKIIYFDIHSQ